MGEDVIKPRPMKRTKPKLTAEERAQRKLDYQKEWRAKNPTYQRDYHRRNSKRLNKKRRKTDRPYKQSKETRREYQATYYQAHKEKCREYQRDYNKNHKKKAKHGSTIKSNPVRPREAVKISYNSCELMDRYMCGDKLADLCNKILARERTFSI